MGNLNKKRDRNRKEDEEHKKNIKNLLCDYINILKYKNTTICNSNLYSESPLLANRSKNVLKQNQSVCFALEIFSEVISQLNVQESNLDLLSNAFIPKFSEGPDMTFDFEEMQKLNTDFKSWIDKEGNRVRSMNLVTIGETLPKPDNIPIFSEDISSINIKDSNNINTISENGSYAEEELLSNSQVRNRKTDKSLAKKLNMIKKIPIHRHSTVNVFPNKESKIQTEKSSGLNTGNKVLPLFNILNINKKKEITSEQSSKILLKDKNEVENLISLNKDQFKSPHMIDSNNLVLNKNQNEKLNEEFKSPLFSPSQNKLDNKSTIKNGKNNNTDGKKKTYNKKIKDKLEDGDEDIDTSDQISQPVSKKLGVKNRETFSQEKKIKALNDYMKGNEEKASLQNRKKTLKTVNIISPLLLGGSPNSKAKEVKFVSSKNNKYVMGHKKTGETQEKDISKNNTMNIVKKTSKKNMMKQFSNIEDPQQKRKYLKIDIRQLENEEKTTEDSSSVPRPFSLEKMNLDQVLNSQNMQRCKRAEFDNIILAVSKSPNTKKRTRLDNIKNNIFTNFK
jgi:hypothetical protein